MRHYALLTLFSLLLLATPGCPSGQGSTQDASAAPVSTEVSYQVEFVTTKGTIVLDVHRGWAPRGADRFRELVESGYFDGCSFFRVVEGFVVQFGLSGDPSRTAEWKGNTISDDPVFQTNSRGTLTFATGGPNTRTTQLFFNLNDNPRLDKMGFSPFAKVVSGQEVIDALFSGYGEGAPRGSGPDQGRLTAEGDPYLSANFPKLDKITTARVLAGK